MKSRHMITFLLCVFGISQAAYAGHSHKIEVGEYPFTATLSELIETLELKFIEKAREECSGAETAQMIGPQIDLDFGTLVGGFPLRKLETTINLGEGEAAVRFSHPSAVLSAHVICGKR